eukprot:4508217-Amphidinium_carterae.1
MEWANTCLGEGMPYLHLPLTALKKLPGVAMWRQVPPTHVFRGRVYSDGSAIHPQIPEARTASWAVVQLDNNGFVEAYAHGLVDRALGPEQTAEDGEMLAAIFALQNSAGCIELCTDCRNLQLGILRGCETSARTNGLRAHLWRLLADAGADRRLEVHKVKAHARRPPDEAPRAEYLDWQGNHEADLLAKAAFRLDFSVLWVATHNATLVRNLQKLGRWVAWQGAALLQSPDTTGFPEQWRQRVMAQGPSNMRALRSWAPPNWLQDLAEQARQDGLTHRARRQRIAAGQEVRTERLLAPIEPAKLRAVHGSHKLHLYEWVELEGRRVSLVACHVCGAYMQSRAGLLSRPCTEILSR